jgi:hypothetical protein
MMDCWGVRIMQGFKRRLCRLIVTAEIVENGVAILIELLGIQFGTKMSLWSIEA